MFALLVAPAAAAQQLTMRPLAGLLAQRACSRCWSCGSGSGIAYFSIYPVGFYVTTTFAFACT